jgi:hypothetical protein
MGSGQLAGGCVVLSRAVDSTNRLCRAYGVVVDAMDGAGARPRRALCQLPTQTVV